jgi:hypothetical protein
LQYRGNFLHLQNEEIMLTKLFKSALVVMLVIAGCFAGAPTYGATDAVYEYGGLDYTISSGSFDTLVGTDSTTLVSGKIFNPDWQYILTRGAITGTGSDSVKLEVRADCLDSDGSLMYSVAIDSLTASSGEAIFIPIMGTIFGSKLRIKLVAYTGNGGQVILNNLRIFKRRPITVNKVWR